MTRVLATVRNCSVDSILMLIDKGSKTSIDHSSMRKYYSTLANEFHFSFTIHTFLISHFQFPTSVLPFPILCFSNIQEQLKGSVEEISLHKENIEKVKLSMKS